MSFEDQLKRHLDAATGAEPDIPACLDESLRVQEWAQFYPAVDLPPTATITGDFFAKHNVAQYRASPQTIANILDEHAGSANFRDAKMEELEDRLANCEGRLSSVSAQLAEAMTPTSVAAAGEASSWTATRLLRSEHDGDRAAELHSILEDVEQVNLELCLLEKFTATCRDCFDLYIGQIWPQALEPYADSVNQVGDSVQPDRERINRFIDRLSRIYDELRRGGGLKEKGEAKVGTSFVRKSIKYWVHTDNLTEVKCHVLRHLPIFAFPNKDGTPHNPAITSVYYDNDHLDLYTGRLLKQDEAIALRIRWYGTPSQPVVYIENKIHYEDWTGEPSTKSRFGLEEARVNAYMSGEYNLDARIKELIAQGKVPRKEVDAMDTLAKNVQRTVRERDLKPMMRTFYNRTAFQLVDSARVRLSLDEDLTFVREDARVVGRRLVNGTIDKNWRRRDVGIEWPFDDLPENEVHHFPYAIMEVKLQTEAGKEPPLWARELMQSDLVQESPKFSKFVHGCVSLLEPLTPLYPYWLHQMHVDIRHRRQFTILELTRTAVDVPWATPPAAHVESVRRSYFRASVSPSFGGRGDGGSGSGVLNPHRVSEASASIATRTALYRQSVNHSSEFPSSPGSFGSGMYGPTGTRSSAASSPTAPLSPAAWKDKAPSFMNRLSVNPTATGSGLFSPAAAAAAGEREGSVGEGSGARSAAANSKVQPAGAPLTYLPTRPRKLMIPNVIEPKVHLANERTFLGWTHYALFLINGATAVLAFTANAPALFVLRYLGIAVCAGGLSFLLVGLHVREVRHRKIIGYTSQRLDTIIPLFVILVTVTFAVAVNWFAVFYY